MNNEQSEEVAVKGLYCAQTFLKGQGVLRETGFEVGRIRSLVLRILKISLLFEPLSSEFFCLCFVLLFVSFYCLSARLVCIHAIPEEMIFAFDLDKRN